MEQTPPFALQIVETEIYEILWIPCMPFHVELTSWEDSCYKKNTWLQKDKNTVLPDQKAGAGRGILDCSEITAEKENKCTVTYRVRLLSHFTYR